MGWSYEYDDTACRALIGYHCILNPKRWYSLSPCLYVGTDFISANSFADFCTFAVFPSMDLFRCMHWPKLVFLLRHIHARMVGFQPVLMDNHISMRTLILEAFRSKYGHTVIQILCMPCQREHCASHSWSWFSSRSIVVLESLNSQSPCCVSRFREWYRDCCVLTMSSTIV